jgi:hypothetical protein
MRKLIAILVLILFANVAIAQDEYVERIKRMSKLSIEKPRIPGYGDDYYGLILKQASKDWQGDSVMIAIVVKMQCKAFCEWLGMEKPVGMSEKTFRNIQAGAMVDWTKQDSNGVLIEACWVMVLHVTEKLIKAYLATFHCEPFIPG